MFFKHACIWLEGRGANGEGWVGSRARMLWMLAQPVLSVNLEVCCHLWATTLSALWNHGTDFIRSWEGFSDLLRVPGSCKRFSL